METGTHRGETTPIRHTRGGGKGLRPSDHDYQMEVFEKPTVDCTDFVALLGDLTDGDLKPSLAARLDEHLGRCRHCRELRDGYVATVRAAKLLADAPVPAGVRVRLYEALNSRLGISLPVTANEPAE